MRRATPRAVLTSATLALCLVALSGCGSSNDNKSKSTSSATSSTAASPGTANPAVAGKVPAKYKSKGTLIVASDARYPPIESIGGDGKTIEGMDADLAKALASEMGLKANVTNATFDAIIPGLASGKYDLGMSAFTDTKEREQTVDFVTYFSAARLSTSRPRAAQRSTRSPSCAGRRSRSRRHDAAGRRRGPEQEVRRQGGEGPDLPGPERREPRALQRPAAGRDGRLAGRRLPGQEVQPAVQARRQVLRLCAVRHRDPQEQRARAGGQGRTRGPDEERPVPVDPQALEHRVGPAQEPGDQRGAELGDGVDRAGPSQAGGTARSAAGGTRPPSRPLAGERDRPVPRGRRDPLGGDEPALRLANGGRLPLHAPHPRGPREDARADGHRDGRRGRPRRCAG